MKQKSVLITGAKTGYGFALAQTYLKNEYMVYTCGREANRNEQLSKLKESYPATCHLLDLDVTNEEMIKNTVDYINETNGKLDILINNAGILTNKDSLDTLNTEEFINIFKVNSISPIFMSRAFLGLLKKSDSAKIINVSSTWGSIWFKSDKNHGGNASYYKYCASKAALNMLTRTLAYELEKDNIITVVIHPGGKGDAGGGPKNKLESAESMFCVINELTIKDTSKFFTWQGFEFPW